MGRLKLFLRQRVLSRLLLQWSRLLWMGGRVEAADRAAYRAVTLAPESYAARLLHGKLLLAGGRGGDAIDEFRFAYHLNPHRFLSSQLPLAIREEVVLLALVPEVPESREEGLEPRPFQDEDWGELAELPSPSEDDLLACTDFQNLEEWRRFRALPPLSRDEVRRVDVDRLARQLSSPGGEALDQG